MTFRGHLPLLLLVSLVGTAQAVEFDEKVKAPRAATPAALKSEFEVVAVRGNPVALNAIEAVRDRTLARQRFDANWKLSALIDAHTPLPELEALGLVARDGGYVIDTAKHPEWHPLEQRLLLLNDAQLFDSIEPALRQRGFRDQDFDAVRGYVQSHDLDGARTQSKLTLALSASRMAKKLQKLKRLDDQFMASYVYQRSLDAAEVERQWAVGLLDALAPQAQRVLASFLGESSGTTYITPTPTAEAYRGELETLLRPDFEELARNAAKEGKL